MFIAVETSDLVHSTEMSQALYAQAIACLEQELASHHETMHTQYEIFRGDAFQVFYPEPSQALRLSLMIKLKLMHAIEGHPIEITQAIAYGSQDISEPNVSQDNSPNKSMHLSQSISKNMGSVFIASGRLLDQVKRRSLAIEFPSQQAAVNVIQSFLQHLLTGLTQKQAEVLYYYLKENFPEQKLIADTLNITRQNVAAHLKRGGADLLKHTIEFFEQCCEVTR